MSNQEVRKGEELPEQQLKEYLLQIGVINIFKSELLVKQYTHGYSNLTYLLQIEQNEFVLRKPPKGAIKRGHDMHREFKVQKALINTFTMVPKMIGYSNDENILGSEFYIMQKVEGIILNYKEAQQRNIQAEQYSIIANTWLETLVKLHKVNYKEIGLADLGKPQGYVERQVNNWGKQFLKAKTEDYPESEMVMNWLKANQPKNYESCLIHNDFKYDNVVFKDESWQKISAVLDWEMATLGDPLMDLGTSLGYWTVATDHDFVKQGIPSPTIFEGNPIRSEIVEMYALKSGRDVSNIVFYYAFGLFKIAVIAQQIYYRYSKGFTTDKRFVNLNKAAELCCKLALKAIQTKSID
ncbi:MAG: phosphotransferase family protein [Flavobacteriaceae bacterium]|nr:phosphotransferase family protein [Flavobacteriaceae bacterium]